MTTKKKEDDEKRVKRTYAKEGTLRELLRYLTFIVSEKGAEVLAFKWYPGAPRVSGHRQASRDNDKRNPDKKRTGRPKKNTGRMTRAEYKKKQAAEASRRYRARQKQQNETPHKKDTP